MSNVNHTLLALCYGLIALLYILSARINLPEPIDEWFHNNHNIILLTTGVLYLCISLIYLYSNFH